MKCREAIRELLEDLNNQIEISSKQEVENPSEQVGIQKMKIEFLNNQIEILERLDELCIIQSIEFTKNDKIRVVLSDSVTEISEEAFFCCELLGEIAIPDSVTKIGDCAFARCTSLESITLPESVTEIGEGAFVECRSLESITLPESVTEIGEKVFMGCTSLESITLPDSVTKIGEEAFEGCTSLESITLPKSVTEIGKRAFLDCDSLATIYCTNKEQKQMLIDSVLPVQVEIAIKDKAQDKGNGLKKVYVPKSQQTKTSINQ